MTARRCIPRFGELDDATDALAGRLVHVYRNLHKDCWSVQAYERGGAEGRYGWRVVAHVCSLFLVRVEFDVSERGRKRVLASRRKNVHAWVCGEVKHGKILRNAQRVRYCPYEGPYFRVAETDEALSGATAAHLGRDGKVYVVQPTLLGEGV